MSENEVRFDALVDFLLDDLRKPRRKTQRGERGPNADGDENSSSDSRSGGGRRGSGRRRRRGQGKPTS